MIDWFGRKAKVELNALRHHVAQMERNIGRYHIEIGRIREQLKDNNRALGRIYAKLEPNFVRDELDPVRRAESDKIGDKAIQKLIGEFRASNPFGDS